jgi:hypothetical protein
MQTTRVISTAKYEWSSREVGSYLWLGAYMHGRRPSFINKQQWLLHTLVVKVL